MSETTAVESPKDLCACGHARSLHNYDSDGRSRDPRFAVECVVGWPTGYPCECPGFLDPKPLDVLGLPTEWAVLAAHRNDIVRVAAMYRAHSWERTDRHTFTYNSHLLRSLIRTALIIDREVVDYRKRQAERLARQQSEPLA